MDHEKLLARAKRALRQHFTEQHMMGGKENDAYLYRLTYRMPPEELGTLPGIGKKGVGAILGWLSTDWEANATVTVYRATFYWGDRGADYSWHKTRHQAEFAVGERSREHFDPRSNAPAPKVEAVNVPIVASELADWLNLNVPYKKDPITGR